MISPTDCVKEWLAAYYHWGDQQCLYQATLVAQANDVDLEDIRSWSVAEGKKDEFEAIIDKLAGKA